MPTYSAKVFGWIAIIDAPHKREAVRVAKQLAPGCSLRPSDVNKSHVRRATEEEIAWYAAMSR